MSTKLTNHFSQEEFGKDIPNIHIPNLVRLACCLEEIRSVINDPMIVTSGYRSGTDNVNAGGVPTSYHLTGDAADFKPRSLSLLDAMAKLHLCKDRLVLSRKLILDSRIGKQHIHVESRRPTDNSEITMLVETESGFEPFDSP